MRNNTTISIIGAGPVGTVMALYFANKKAKVSVYEKRSDPRTAQAAEGRSINIALSHRGLRTLKELGLEEKVMSISIPMKGRMIHLDNGQLNFQPYGREGQMIYSVSRNELNKLLINEAATKHNVPFHFNTHCEEVDIENKTLLFTSENEKLKVASDVIIGGDGAFSAVRKSFESQKKFSQNKEFLSHGYIELHMPPGKEGKHAMETNALHIWPRGKFMLIALPNTDGSFTCTLFLPTSGELSFESVNTKEKCIDLFQTYFSDVIPLIPNYKENFFAFKPSFLMTMECFPWHYNTTLLIGDAAHAITPFYGQGMNAGFEDCRILNQILSEESEWEMVFRKFEEQRKANTDAVAELALNNFIEMRDLVADKNFILRKKIEALIHQQLPAYLPLYTMVTFSDMPYEDAFQLGKEHDLMMKKVMEIENIEAIYNTEEGWRQIQKVIGQI